MSTGRLWAATLCCLPGASSWLHSKTWCDSECDACTWCLSASLIKASGALTRRRRSPPCRRRRGRCCCRCCCSCGARSKQARWEISAVSQISFPANPRGTGVGTIGGGGRQKKKSVCGWDNKGLYATNPFWDGEGKQTALPINTQPWPCGDCKFITMPCSQSSKPSTLGKCSVFLLLFF